jgi:cytochrome c5
MSNPGRVGLLAGLLLLGTDSVVASQRFEDGQRVYAAACASCHDTGAGGAPVTAQPDDWTGRSALWEAVLFEHVKQGYLEMPARGGEPGLTDYDVEAAAEYMLDLSHPAYPRDSAD